jgi:RNA polymerase sigma-70 factor, ECF subfamily
MSLESVYREEGGRILATLIRVVGDFDLAEEVMHDAFAAALEQWPGHGIPENPRAWLVATARHKAIDRLRRDARFRERQDEIARWEALREDAPPDFEDAADGRIADDRLRLIFTCCHPSLALEARVALTLRTLGGLTTDEIARAFLVPVPTMAQRLVRAKQKIRQARIPYRVPPETELADRLDGVLSALYLVFNEGYAATAGAELVRRDLCAEAIRLARILAALLPRATEARALLGLMLLHDSRRAARTSASGELVRLEEQDRSLWDAVEIREGLGLTEAALREGGPRYYGLQAAIAALHAESARPSDTDWPQIAALYGELFRRFPSPVIELNLAAAVAEAHGAEEGLRRLDALEASGRLPDYHLLPAARAQLLARLGQRDEAAAAFRRALELVANDSEKRFLERELARITSPLTLPAARSARGGLRPRPALHEARGDPSRSPAPPDRERDPDNSKES